MLTHILFSLNCIGAAASATMQHVLAFIMSRLDYCKICLWMSISTVQQASESSEQFCWHCTPLHRVHCTLLLYDLHWPPVWGQSWRSPYFAMVLFLCLSKSLCLNLCRLPAWFVSLICPLCYPQCPMYQPGELRPSLILFLLLLCLKCSISLSVQWGGCTSLAKWGLNMLYKSD